MWLQICFLINIINESFEEIYNWVQLLLNCVPNLKSWNNCMRIGLRLYFTAQLTIVEGFDFLWGVKCRIFPIRSLISGRFNCKFWRSALNFESLIKPKVTIISITNYLWAKRYFLHKLMRAFTYFCSFYTITKFIAVFWVWRKSIIK